MRPTPRFSLFRAAFGVLIAALANSAAARHGEPPYSLVDPAKLARSVPIENVGTIDAALRREQADAQQRAAASALPTKRLAVGDGIVASIGSDRNGIWDLLPDGSRLWRVGVRVAGATDLRFGFARFALPAGATLYVIGASNYYQGPYTAVDAGASDFNSPPVPGDVATIELRIPPGSDAPGAIELTRVGAGFRNLFKQAQDTGPGTSGACNVNVVCPLGEPYPDDIRAVAYYEFVGDEDHGTFICSATLLADVPRDHKNYLLTAAHCITSTTEANSMVVYWNYQSAQCNALVAPAGGFFDDDQHGATLRATRADADFTLVELAQQPDSSWDVYYAGWDASGAEPSGTIGIHHPSGDVKKITAGPAPGTIDNCIGTGGASTNTHWETGPYSQGTTESGSSGSGLFVQAGNGGGHDRLLIGTLSGGLAACSVNNPTQPNNETDCYGKLASAWNGPSASSRLRDWLDPANTGTLVGAGIDSQTSSSDTRVGHSHHQRPARPFESRD
jgi:lysyl endopeptidase